MAPNLSFHLGGSVRKPPTNQGNGHFLCVFLVDNDGNIRQLLEIRVCLVWRRSLLVGGFTGIPKGNKHKHHCSFFWGGPYKTHICHVFRLEFEDVKHDVSQPRATFFWCVCVCEFVCLGGSNKFQRATTHLQKGIKRGIWTPNTGWCSCVPSNPKIRAPSSRTLTTFWVKVQSILVVSNKELDFNYFWAKAVECFSGTQQGVGL